MFVSWGCGMPRLILSCCLPACLPCFFLAKPCSALPWLSSSPLPPVSLIHACFYNLLFQWKLAKASVGSRGPGNLRKCAYWMLSQNFIRSGIYNQQRCEYYIITMSKICFYDLKGVLADVTTNEVQSEVWFKKVGITPYRGSAVLYVTLPTVSDASRHLARDWSIIGMKFGHLPIQEGENREQ